MRSLPVFRGLLSRCGFPACGLLSRHLARMGGLAAGVLCCSAWAWAQTGMNGCDLNQDGVVNQADVSLAVNMTLGLAPCTATIQSGGVCTVVLVQRVANAAAPGGTCLSDAPAGHSVALTWVSSTSSNVTGYNIYRSSAAAGPYTKLNPTLVTGTTYSDAAVASGQTYYYVSTAVDIHNLESNYSNVAQAVIPSP